MKSMESLFDPVALEEARDSAGARRVAVLWSPAGRNVMSAVRSGVDTALYRHGYRSITMDLFSDEPGVLERDRDAMFARILEDALLPGVLTAFVDLPESIAERLHEKGKAIVSIERPTAWRRKGNLCLDRGLGARLAAAALLELGRKRIGFIGPVHEHGWAGGERFRQVEAALAGLEGVELFPVDAYRQEMDMAAMATGALLDAHPDVDAIIFTSDIHAIAGLVVLKDRGRKVPLDVCVIAFDDSIAARLSVPPISSIQQPFAELGRLAGEMLMDVVAAHRKDLDDVRLPERLILRGSCLKARDAEVEYQPGEGMLDRLGLIPG
jgi:DNA-binding LacI/PurR family transcriptional regulator